MNTSLSRRNRNVLISLAYEDNSQTRKFPNLIESMGRVRKIARSRSMALKGTLGEFKKLKIKSFKVQGIIAKK